jgi:uncharacterized membrane protein
MFCQYKNILGKVGEGVHKYRIFNIAIVDVILTIIVGLLISYIFNTNLFLTLLILFVLGIIAHRIFCVQTTVDKFLFYK